MMYRTKLTPGADVYLAAIPEQADPAAIASDARRREIEETKASALRLARTADWLLLELALRRSLGLDPAKLAFFRSAEGRWSAEGVSFSLSHTESFAAVAVSREPVGIDAENIARFAVRCARDAALTEHMLRRICAESENPERDSASLLRLWTAKESLFKFIGSGSFRPSRLRPGEETRQFVLLLDEPLFLSVSADHPENIRFFLACDGAVSPIESGSVLDGDGDLSRWLK